MRIFCQTSATFWTNLAMLNILRPGSSQWVSSNFYKLNRRA